MSVLWTIIIGFIVGVIAKFIMPGDKYEPKGFVLTTILGIVGAFVSTYLGQAIGWYKPGESAGFIGGVIGAIILLAVYGFLGVAKDARPDGSSTWTLTADLPVPVSVRG